MEAECAEISVKGVVLKVPVVRICDRAVIVHGKWIKVASVYDEDWLVSEAVTNPELFIATLSKESPKPDLVTFAQRIPHTTPDYNYYFDWDNYAAIPITSYTDWWEKRLPQESRRNVRLSTKRGIAVRQAAFDDELVSGIMGIYNETPMRQGRPFWHYGKAFETVKRENGTYVDRSEFIGAYLGTELVGFIKMVYLDRSASIMQILAKNAHLEKKPMNALLAKAVEVCDHKGMEYLFYTQFTYGNVYSPLTEFKRRNGFEEIRFPRYYVPLTTMGDLCLRLKLHRGFRARLSPQVISRLIAIRRAYYQLTNRGQFAKADSR
jgi:hypothetical protein